MSRIDQATLATTILSAPGWARVGITAPSERLLDDAAHELARAIIDLLGAATREQCNPDQLALAL